MQFELNEAQTLLYNEMLRWGQNTLPKDQLQAHVTEIEAQQAQSATILASHRIMRTQLAQMGVFGTLVQEQHGGSHLGGLEAALIANVLGQLCYPVNFQTSVLAALALAETSDAVNNDTLSQLCKQKLAGVLSGESGCLLAWDSARYDGSGLDIQSQAAMQATISGVLYHCHGDADADVALCIGSDAVWLVVGTSPFDMTPQTSIDKSRGQWTLKLDQASAIKTPLSVDTTLDLARLLLAADTVGAQQTMLAMAVDYASERQQFGRVIGSFQAVKHLCAEMAAQIEPNIAFLWYAGYCYDNKPEEFALMAALLKADADECGTFVARSATEVHGGMGFTDLMGLHLWFKRLNRSRQMFGAPHTLRERAMQLQNL